MTQQTTQPAQAAQGDPAEIMQMVDTLIASMNEAHHANSEGWRDACFQSADRVREKIKDAVAALTEQRSAQGEPKVNIKAETCSNGVTGTTYLNVVRIEVEDDGSLTAVTDAAIAASGRQE